MLGDGEERSEAGEGVSSLEHAGSESEEDEDEDGQSSDAESLATSVSQDEGWIRCTCILVIWPSCVHIKIHANLLPLCVQT